MNNSDRLALTKCIKDAQSAVNIRNFAEAEKCLTSALQRVQKVEPGLHFLILYSLATFHCTQNNYDEAERLYLECIPLNETALFPFHYYLAELYTDIGAACLAAARYDDAKKYFNEALERLDKPDAIEELSRMINRVLLELGKVHLAQQNFDQAEACVKRTVADAEKQLLKGGKNLEGTYETQLATRQYELVKILIAQKRYTEAETLCTRVLDIRETHHEYVKPPTLAETLLTLADVRDAQERGAESKVLRERANDLMNNWFEPEQNDFEYELEQCIDVCLRALKDDQALAQIFEQQITTQARRDFSMKRYAQAEQCFRRLLRTKEELVGPHHLDILKELDFIQMLTLQQKNFAEAEAISLRQLQIVETQLGKNHFAVADKLKWIAAIKICQNEFAAAEPFYARSFAITEELLYPDSWLFAHCLTTFADLREMQGKEDEAEILNQSAYQVFSKHPAANQRFYPSALFNIPGATYPSLHMVLSWTGNSEGALTLLIKTLNSREEALGTTNQNVGTAACRLAAHYWQEERLSEAETIYRKALKIFEASPEPQSADISCCHTSLVYLMRAMKRYGEANEYEAKRQELKTP